MEKMNIYCDESCHLEHDHEKIMVIGGIRCLKKHRRRICGHILEIKRQYGIPQIAEIKWTKISTCNVDYFKALINYFFDCKEMEFRCVVVNKDKIDNERFNQTHDDFYYKMYFHCLSGLISPYHENYIYIDKKDTRGSYKINQMKLFLCRKTHDFDQSRISRIQCVTSADIPILQMTDLLIGAIGYHNRDIRKASDAKRDIVNLVKKRSGYTLERSTFLSENKFNMFFIKLKE